MFGWLREMFASRPLKCSRFNLARKDFLALPAKEIEPYVTVETSAAMGRTFTVRMPPPSNKIPMDPSRDAGLWHRLS
jgi:hypothetical protein